MTNPVIGYVGMTHLGLISAIAAAEKGCNVVCLDTDAALIGRLNAGELPVNEPQCPELLEKNRDRLTFTADAGALARCDIVYVAPDVATDDAGNSDLAAIDTLLELAAGQARADALLIVLSQVPPGYTRAHGGLRQRLFYQVETLVFGRAIERALYPERFIVGAGDAEAALPDVYREFLDLFDCPLLVMRYESAELAKISINCCLVASITTANMLAELCENIGADWAEIAPALKLDARIGPKSYLTPGLGIAGGNLERDLATVLRLADAHGADVFHHGQADFLQLSPKFLQGGDTTPYSTFNLTVQQVEIMVGRYAHLQPFQALSQIGAVIRHRDRHCARVQGVVSGQDL